MKRWKVLLRTLWVLGILSVSAAAIYGQADTPETPAPPASTAATPTSTGATDAAGTTSTTGKEAQVAPFHRVIFSIYANSGPFSPKERAEHLELKINQINDDADFSPDRLKVVPDGDKRDIVYGDDVVMSVSGADATALKQPLEDAAEYYRDNIADAIEQYRKDTELLSILTQIGLVVLILAAFFFIIRCVNRLFQLITRKIDALKGTIIKGVKIKSYDILDESRCIAVILFAVRIVKYVFLLTVLYFSVTLLFSIFPGTRGLASKLLDYVLTPFSNIVFGVIGYVPKAIAIGVIVTIFRYLIKGVKYFAGEIEKKRLVITGFYPDWAMPTYNIVRTLLLAFMLVVIFPYLPNSNTDVFKGVSVFFGVIVSLGSTSLVGNLMSGLVMTYMRPFRVGDFIKIGDITGTVQEKTPFAIRVTTVKNEEITIPNANALSSHTTNYSDSVRGGAETGGGGLILHAAVTFGYDTPWRQVHELLLQAAARTQHALAEPKPFVLQNALDNFFVEYNINIYTREEKQILATYSNLYANIQDVFKEAGLDMVCPAYQNFRGENRLTVR